MPNPDWSTWLGGWNGEPGLGGVTYSITGAQVRAGFIRVYRLRVGLLSPKQGWGAIVKEEGACISFLLMPPPPRKNYHKHSGFTQHILFSDSLEAGSLKWSYGAKIQVLAGV